jgi:hypothetical protein
VSRQTFTLGVQTTFAIWQSLYFGVNANSPNVSGALANPSGNGLPNLLQYAIGSNPLADTPTAPLPTVAPALSSTDGKWYLALTATLDATASGITVGGEVSADLQTWNSDPNDLRVVSDSTVGAVRTLILQDATAIGATAHHYIRLRVTQP